MTEHQCCRYYSDQNEKKCMLCPFNTYSDGAANEECSVCPYEKKTTEQGSISADQCVGRLLVILVQSYLDLPWGNQRTTYQGKR